jgi:hypothetical protein
MGYGAHFINKSDFLEIRRMLGGIPVAGRAPLPALDHQGSYARENRPETTPDSEEI